MTRMELIGEGLSIIAGVCLWISVIAKSHRSMVKWQTMECSVRVAGCFLLGGLSGSFMLFVCVFRNLAVNYFREKNREDLVKIAVLLSMIIQIVTGYMTFHHLYDLLTICTSLIFNACMLSENVLLMRFNILQNMSCWFLYSICIHGIVMIVTYGIMTATAVVALATTLRQRRLATSE